MENEQPQLFLDQNAIEQLRIARKWSNFISIVAIVMMGIMIAALIGFFIVGAWPGRNDFGWKGTFLQVVPMLLLIGLYTFPIYYLYQFGRHSKIAISGHDSASLSKAFGYLKLHYRFMGILLIAALVFYAIAFAIMITAFSHFFPN